jgi:hypothetical protein
VSGYFSAVLHKPLRTVPSFNVKIPSAFGREARLKSDMGFARCWRFQRRLLHEPVMIVAIVGVVFATGG